MNGKQIGGIVCLILAAALSIVAVVNVSCGPNVANPSGLGVSSAVGSFLPPVFALIIGLSLLQKPKQRGPKRNRR